GCADLDAGVLRAVGDPAQRFGEDHLRLLRAVRFAARLEFAMAPETYAALCTMAPLVVKTSAERIRDELLKMLIDARARRAFELLDETGLLQHVLPEVARMKNVEQPAVYHPEGDVFEHTMLMLELMKAPTPTLAMGVLLHDVGKPLTQTFEDRIRFNSHDKVGAHEAKRICKRLRMPREQMARVVWLVANHMRLGMASRMRTSKLKRFVREEGFDELLELGRIDCEASHRGFEHIEWIQDFLDHIEPETLKPPPLLTGADLVAMGYEPGPLFSRMLEAVEDAQLEGRIETSEQARTFVAERWPC
ncbi:MAG TPA: HD domain-containing protein, partial [Candidatus Hydrogenedentes bacterium]|nr:HD domain-containing protein [Candidatus Hydrogenedentota bacterium]